MKEVYNILILSFFILIATKSYAQVPKVATISYPTYVTLNQLEYKSVDKKSILYNSGFDANKLPIFCKIEHQMQLKSRFPVRIRLGDVRYVNKLESKN